MQENKILLSTGSVLWMNLKDAISFAKKTGYGGLELVPTRKIIKEKSLKSCGDYIKAIHHNWRMDIGKDKKYQISKSTSIVFTLLRLLFFPKVSESQRFIQRISSEINCPIVVHDISPEWTSDNEGKEFYGGIGFEILETSRSADSLKEWLKNDKHFVEIDTRNDQSLRWAKKNGFESWIEFWEWIGLDKIKTIQLSLIGTNGIKKILNHEKSLAEEQLLWLYQQKWNGSVVVEINPLSLFISSKGKFNTGFRVISNFANQALNLGKKWST